MTRNGSIFVSLLLCSVATVAAQPSRSGDLRVGVGRIEITPTDMTLNQMGSEPYLGVHDPIYARAIVMANGSETTAMVSLDLVDLPYGLEPLQDRIQREVGIPADHVIISVTHDHSAPHFSGDAPACPTGAPGGGPGGPGGGPGNAVSGPGGGPNGGPGGGPNGGPGGGANGGPGGGPQGGACSEKAQMQAFTKTTSDKIVQVLKEAKAALQPARMGLGTGSVDVNVNRDLYGPKGWGMGSNPAGPSDKTVWVVKFDTPEGKPIAILFNYAVHSTVTMDGQMVSGDLAGAAERTVEQQFGGNFVALFTLGAAGDQNPKFPEFPPPAWEKKLDRAAIQKYVFSAMDAQGFLLGAEVLRVADQIKPTISDAHIAGAQSTFTCPVRPDKSNEGINGVVPIHLSLILINQIAFVGVSGEVVTNISTHLKKASPLTDTILVTIANGRAGYLADDASYDLPIFEVHGDPAARGCVENGIVNGLTKLMQDHL